jgi:hypothetical protein
MQLRMSVHEQYLNVRLLIKAALRVNEIYMYC